MPAHIAISLWNIPQYFVLCLNQKRGDRYSSPLQLFNTQPIV
ncbi:MULTISPECIES: hypothetical protein [unclassified Okeania]|nr:MULTISPECIES: hypothetical protein [unclassified Okeania]